MNNDKVFQMDFGKVYGLLLDKAARKGRTKAEVDEVVFWLTGYSPEQLEAFRSSGLCYGDFPQRTPAQPEPGADQRRGLRRPGGGDRGPAHAGDPLPGQADRRAGEGEADGEDIT